MVQFGAPLVGPSLAPMDNRQEDTSVEVFATTTHSSEGVDSKTLDDVVDARIDSSRPSPGELDLGLAQQLSNLVQTVASRPHSNDSTVKEKIEEPIYVDFHDGDRRNPANFTKRQKYMITAIACYATLLASTVASTYPMGFTSMMRDLNCTYLQAVTGLSVYTLGFALVPLVTSSFSEEFGRKPLYIVSLFIFLVMFLMIAL
ncbi:hypothetical protein AX14_000603 [Amanita brunnescens Koide BX004]|nr:hypothetical protein AX14_000603 [Amanita brunnescens Koide BX004]